MSKAKISLYVYWLVSPNITVFSGFPGEGIQQPVFPQLPNMDPFQQRMMGMQQDPMRHQVTSGFFSFSLIHYVFCVLYFSLMEKQGSDVSVSEKWIWLSPSTFPEKRILLSILVKLWRTCFLFCTHNCLTHFIFLRLLGFYCDSEAERQIYFWKT